MKEEEWREWLESGDIRLGRYYIRCITGWTSRYSENPGNNTFASKGQLVFAYNSLCSTTCMGQCVSGEHLVPSGVVCGNTNGFCTAGFCTCGFSTGTGTYVALGAACDCGATLWRKIT